MDEKPSNFDMLGESEMEMKPSWELIKKLKEAKKDKEITFPRLIERLEKNGTPISMTTLRRVFADNSEQNDSFSYENTLMPLAEVLLAYDDVPTPENNVYTKEIDGLKAVLHTQNEEIVKLHEIQNHLENRIAFLLEQIEKKDKRMDEKDVLINKLLEKVL